MDDARDKLILVFCTAPAAASGHIARALLEARLVACVNRCAVTSTYWWEGEIENEEEVLLIIKTAERLFDAVERTIREVHPYDIPEIIAVSIGAGSGDYCDWVRREVLPPQ
jgi:periplasmic divalent cation tolerance protein